MQTERLAQFYQLNIAERNKNRENIKTCKCQQLEVYSLNSANCDEFQERADFDSEDP